MEIPQIWLGEELGVTASLEAVRSRMDAGIGKATFLHAQLMIIAWAAVSKANNKFTKCQQL